jgi:hypothetical protein
MKRGRPRLTPEARLVPLSVHVSPKQYEILAKHAHQARVSLAEIIRRQLNKKTF